MARAARCPRLAIKRALVLLASLHSNCFPAGLMIFYVCICEFAWRNISPDSAQLGFSVLQITIRHCFCSQPSPPDHCRLQYTQASTVNTCMQTQTNSNDVSKFAPSPFHLPLHLSLTITHTNLYILCPASVDLTFFFSGFYFISQRASIFFFMLARWDLLNTYWKGKLLRIQPNNLF